MAKKDYILSSGGAIGADQAFESGCDKANGKKIIFTVENFEKSNENINFCCKKLIPVLDPNRDFLKFKYNTKLLLMRDVHQIMGTEKNPFLVKGVIFWINSFDIWNPTVGGTKYATRIAQNLGIPLYNLYDKKIRKNFEKWLDKP